MRRILAFAGFMLLIAVPAMAQTTLKINIEELPEGTPDASAAVRTALLPLVSADPHFTLVSDSSWDLHLIINCLYATSTTDNSRIGVNCSDEIIYQPDKWGGLLYGIGPYIGIGPDEDSVAKGIFADLLDETTVDNIKKADDYLSQLFDGIYKVAASSASKTCTPAKKPAAESGGQPLPH
jgi:hypothetical protein